MALQSDGKIILVGSTYNREAPYSDFAVVRLLGNGSLDTSFGDGGLVTTDFIGPTDSGEDSAYDVKVDAAGRIVVLGKSTGNDSQFIALARYDTDGSLDPTFGVGGLARVTVADLTDRAFPRLALQADGKIVAAGAMATTLDERNDFVVAHFDTHGNLDSTFGEDGIAVTPGLDDGIDGALDVAVQADGKILAVGFASIPGEDVDFALARYLPDGSLDAGFGNSGVLTINFGSWQDAALAVAIQPDNQIVLAGYAHSPTDAFFQPFSGKLALARVLGGQLPVPGELDPTFGQDGKVISDFSAAAADAAAYDVAIQPDGKIVAVGDRFVDDFRGYDFAVARYKPDGSLDPSFGTGGLATVDLGNRDQAQSVEILPGGKILVAGTTGNEPYRVALVRFEADGDLDLSFGPEHTGFVILDSLDSPYVLGNNLVGMALQPSDGKVLVTGCYRRYVGPPSSYYWDFSVMRLTADGNVDTTFGQSGLAIVDFGFGEYSNGMATDVAVQPDGRIVAFGTAEAGFALAGLLGTNGALDPTFGNGGTLVTDFAHGATGMRMALYPDGRIVAAGHGASSASGPLHALLACYTGNGLLDTSFGSEGGTLVVPFEPAATALDVDIQVDGKIVVAGFAGWSFHGEGIPPDFAVARYKSDGSLDAEFGDGGVVMIDFASLFDAATAVAIQPDNKIVLVGGAYAPPGPGMCKFALARLSRRPTSCPGRQQRHPASDRKGLVIQLNDSDLDPALATNPTNFRLTAAKGRSGWRWRLLWRRR